MVLKITSAVNDLILPIFVEEGKNKISKIKSMPGVYKYTIDKLDIIMRKVKKYKINDCIVQTFLHIKKTFMVMKL